jgi:hypothetical protein
MKSDENRSIGLAEAVAIGFVGRTGAFAAILGYVIRHDPAQIGALVGMLGLTVAIEWIYRVTRPEKRRCLT